MIWAWPFRLLVAVLATFRLAQLLALDDGPFDVFALLRNRLELDRDGDPRTGALWSTASALVHCPYCLGVWFAAALTLLLAWGAPWYEGVAFWLATAGGQAALESLTERPT